MPIMVAPLERELRVVKLVLDEKTKKHLENLGITLEAKLSVVSKSGGNVICQVKGGRIALDRSIASKIFVA